MLTLKNVSKSYGDKKAVNKVSLYVKPGEIFGFLVPNGAGKTTTIKMIVGLLAIDEGEIYINQIDNRKEILNAKQQFSFVPDHAAVFEKITGYDYLQFISNIYQVEQSDRENRINYYSDKFNLNEALHSYISSYSHEMKQKIALIGSLLPEPKVLILDEPMVGLDPKAQFILKELLNEHCQKGNSVFLSTHVLEIAEKLCSEIAIINKGEIVASGTMDQLQKERGQKSSLESLFLELTEE